MKATKKSTESPSPPLATAPNFLLDPKDLIAGTARPRAVLSTWLLSTHRHHDNVPLRTEHIDSVSQYDACNRQIDGSRRVRRIKTAYNFIECCWSWWWRTTRWWNAFAYRSIRA